MLTTARLLLRLPRPSDAASFFAHCHASVRKRRRRLAVFEWQRRRAGFAEVQPLPEKERILLHRAKDG